jgi:hypothetical protein
MVYKFMQGGFRYKIFSGKRIYEGKDKKTEK